MANCRCLQDIRALHSILGPLRYSNTPRPHQAPDCTSSGSAPTSPHGVSNDFALPYVPPECADGQVHDSLQFSEESCATAQIAHPSADVDNHAWQGSAVDVVQVPGSDPESRSAAQEIKLLPPVWSDYDEGYYKMMNFQDAPTKAFRVTAVFDVDIGTISLMEHWKELAPPVYFRTTFVCPLKGNVAYFEFDDAPSASRAFKRLHGTRFNGGEVTGHFEVRYYSFTTRKSILVPPRLGKTLSAWIENMNRVEELGRGVAHRYYEESIFAREYWQRKQYNEFLKMTQDYAERYLEDVAEEIFWERTQIDDFEKRLREAEAIHKKVVELRNLFEKQTGKAFKDVNAASSALDQDDLLKEGKKRLEDIRQGFVDLERFWSDEISRVQTAIRKKRHLDREDARRWERFRVDLECALRPSTTHPMPPPLAVPHDRSVLNVGTISVRLLPQLSCAESVLGGLRRDRGARFLPVKTQASLEMTSASLRKGAVLTRALVRRFLAYGEAVLAHCATLAASTHVPYSRMQASDDLRAIICGLQPTSGIGAMLADLEASMPKSARKLIRQAQKASEKHERSLKATLSYLSEKLRNLNEAPALTLEQLMAERDAWRKRKDMVEDALVTLEKRACGDDAASLAEGALRSYSVN